MNVNWVLTYVITTAKTHKGLICAAVVQDITLMLTSVLAVVGLLTVELLNNRQY